VPGLLLAACLASSAAAQGIRDRTRPEVARDTPVSESQAVELTLTVIEAARRPLQTWVRAAGRPDESGRVLHAALSAAEAELVQVGQRVRVFPPESKSRMTQAKVVGVTRDGDRSGVAVALPVDPDDPRRRYVLEIIVDRGMFLAVSNEAIIEEGGDRQVVYVEEHPGHYVPREIQTGLKGELYAEVLHGLAEGDRVVTFGSFFVDAEHKLKETERHAVGNAHQHH